MRSRAGIARPPSNGAAMTASAQRARARERSRGRAPRTAPARALTGPARGSGIRWDRVGRLMIVAVFVLVALLYVHPLWTYWSTRGEGAARRAEVARLEAERDRLQRRVRTLRNPRALEREARSLGMVRPGERAYVVERLPE